MPALVRSSQVVPVGAGIFYSAYRCAAALGKDSEADRYLQRFEALAAYAFANSSNEVIGAPIRIVQASDADALVNASGLELLYSTYDPNELPHYFPHRYVLWDAENKRERHLRFEFLDTLIRLKHKAIYHEFPFYRPLLAKQMIAELVKDKVQDGVDADLILQAAGKSDVGDRITLLKANVGSHGVLIAQALASECLRDQRPACDGAVVDALLPFAEKNLSLPTLQLALLYAIGMGVPQDEKSASVLLEKAEARLGEGRGYALFASMALQLKEKGTSALALVRQKLETGVAHGQLMPTLVLASVEVGGANGKISDATFDGLEKLAKAGRFPSYQTYGFALVTRGRTQEAAPWLVQAAEHGEGEAQLAVARLYRDGQGVAVDAEKARHWLVEAGHSGKTAAMLDIGDYQREVMHDGQRAEGWYTSANQLGNIEGALRLGELYLGPLTGMVGGTDDALAIFRELDTRFDRPEARRDLVYMYIEGKGVAKDVAHARQLLLKDAENSDARSRSLLGLGLLEGRLGPVDEVQGQHWLNLAIDQGSSEAMDGLAQWLSTHKNSAEDIARAKSLWQQAVDKGSASAINDFAWASCTATNSAMFDPKKGLLLMQKLDRLDMGWSRVDTLAACQAANGDFAGAQAAQAQAIDTLTKINPKSSSLANLQARLALYKRNQVYRSDGRD
jgi:TPR repeat protein